MRYLILVTMIGLLTGCGSSMNCNDSDTKKTVLQLIQSDLEKAAWYQDMKADISDVDVSGVSTASKDDEEHMTCAATYSFTYKGSHFESQFTYNLTHLEDKNDTQVSVDADDIKVKVMGIAMGGH